VDHLGRHPRHLDARDRGRDRRAGADCARHPPPLPAQAPALATRLLALSLALGGHLSLALDIPVERERRAAFGLGAAWTAAGHHGAPEATPWRWLATISGGRVLPTNTRLPDTGRQAQFVLKEAPPSGRDSSLQAVRTGLRHHSRRAPH
jgi:hypothetical protein